MSVRLEVRNESTRKRLYTRAGLQQLAERICEGEGVRSAAELSVLFCDDPFIRELNEQFRGVNAATDVLSFNQSGTPEVAEVSLGDIVISLETVDRRNSGDRDRMRAELRLLFCHGVLHLLGMDHATESARRAMVEKQAAYLNVTPEAAWIGEPVAADA